MDGAQSPTRYTERSANARRAGPPQTSSLGRSRAHSAAVLRGRRMKHSALIPNERESHHMTRSSRYLLRASALSRALGRGRRSRGSLPANCDTRS